MNRALAVCNIDTSSSGAEQRMLSSKTVTLCEQGFSRTVTLIYRPYRQKMKYKQGLSCLVTLIPHRLVLHRKDTEAYEQGFSCRVIVIYISSPQAENGV